MKLGSILGVGGGLLAWTFTEYVTHRIPMHGRRGSSPLADEHLDHHGDPSYTVPLAFDGHNLAFKTAAYAAGRLLVSPAFGFGFATGYAGYTYLHHRIHHRPPRGSLSRSIWRHHYRHHFTSPRRNFGVTTPLWDVLLHSRAANDSRATAGSPVKLPAGRAPAWLLDRPDSYPDYVVLPAVDARIAADRPPASLPFGV